MKQLRRRHGIDMLRECLPSEWETTTMEPVRSVAELCADHGLDCKDLAAKSGLDESRVEAIVAGRWTPSPSERDRIAAVFRLSRDQIAWGHKNPIAHVYGHGPQFGRSP
jgi:transcriptional regulator with XRE-family HTH domain